MTFSALNLSSLVTKALPSLLETPTQIQQLAIPAALSGQDLLALAQTGSGKTFAFGLPLLSQLDVASEKVQAVVIVPTRELASQVSASLRSVGDKMGVGIATLCGGVDQAAQLLELEKAPQIVVATPGRLLDFLNQEVLLLDGVNQLVFDEADRLLDMGFWPDIKRLLTFMPSKYQALCFSATMPEPLEKVLADVLNSPLRLEAHAANSVVAEVEERLYLVNKGSKTQALIAQIKQHQWQQVLVFISAKDSADALAKKLTKAGIAVAALHGNKDQTVREQTLAEFKANKIQVLIATDLLARGIHVEALPVVINFDLPPSAPIYVHRVGRTARAGQSGLAISLVCHGESEALQAIRSLTNRELPLLVLEGFPVTDKPTTGERKRAPRDKQANRRSAKKRSIKQFQKTHNVK